MQPSSGRPRFGHNTLLFNILREGPRFTCAPLFLHLPCIVLFRCFRQSAPYRNQYAGGIPAIAARLVREEEMGKVIVMTNLQFQPSSQRTVLRNLLRRALAAPGRDRFLVTILVNPTP